jgi:hypothetical protein
VPQQCPECARFLSKSFVEGLATAPAPCPKCAAPLTAELFSPAESDRPPAGPDRSPAGSALDADAPRDVLAGWDRDDEEVVDMARWRRDHRGLAPEALAVVAAGAAALGAAAGASMSRDSRGRGAFLGVVLAAVVGVVAGSRLRH